MLTPHDHQRVAEAVAKADAATSGEIVCILAREVPASRDTPLAAAAAVALLGPPILLLAGVRAEAIVPWAREWSAGAGGAPARLLEAWGLLQVVVFAIVAGIVSIPAVRRALTPPSLKRRRVHRAALQQFLATGLHLSEGRTGVVIFAALHDRRVEILADDAIHRAVGERAWTASMDAVRGGMRRGSPADGFVAAVSICGAALAEHFPSEGPRANALSDRLREL